MQKTHKTECIVDFDDGNEIFGSNEKKKEAIWQLAFKQKTFLFKDSNHLQELEVDFSTFDMLLGTTTFNRNDRVNQLTMFKALWRSLWPYLHNLVKSYYQVQAAWDALVEDQDTVLKNYADQNLELKIYKEYMSDMVDPITGEDFNAYYAARMAEDEAAMEEIRIKELANSLGSP